AAVIQVAASANVPVTARGAGTGLVGGALGDGLVLDLGRHNRQIHSLNRDERTVQVGAGVVLDQLNAWLKPDGLCFGPAVATSSRATLGGMIANNSSGARVPLYGTTADHVLTLELVTADGQISVVGLGCEGLAAQQEIASSLVGKHADEIRQ